MGTLSKLSVSTLSVLGGAVVLAAAFAVVPAAAKKKTATPASVETEAAHPDDPLMVIVSLGGQKAEIYRGMSLITTTRISSGKRGYSTKAGVYSILEKRRRHYSNLYAGAPMPYMQRMTWSGTALHAGVVPGYPASHGCIRLPHSFAPKLFSMTDVGEQVVVANGTVRPRRISHPALFQPLPLPMPPTLVNKDDGQPVLMRKSSNDAKPAPQTRLPVILAKAEGPAPQPAATSRTAPIFARNIEVEQSARHKTRLAVAKDTKRHAIDPHGPTVVGSDIIPAAPRRDVEVVETQDAPVASPETVATASLETAAPSVSDVEVSDADPSIPDVSTEVAALPADETVEPQAGPILNVSATALAETKTEPVAVSVAVLGLNSHPPLPPVRPSVMLTKLAAGTAAAAVEAAEPHSPEPLRILITRRTKRDRLRDVQYILSGMDYLKPQNFDGTFGRASTRAIKAFQKDNDMPETGAFTDDVEKKIYAVAGKEMPSQGHLFVRQKFAHVFDTPVSFKNPDKKLGTHVFTALHFEPGATKAQWTAVSLNDKEDAHNVLNRIEIPDDVRRNISERLTPGSALIIADTAINTATLPTGADFLVWDTSQAPKVHRASVRPKPRRKKRVYTRRRPSSGYSRRYRRNSPFPF